MATTESVLTWEILAERAMNKADAVFTASADIISNAVTAYGPQAVEMMLTVIQIDNIQRLVYGGLLFILMVTTTIIFGRQVIKHIKEDCNGVAGDCEPYPTLMLLIPFILATMTLPYQVNSFFNVWTWVGAVEPKVWVAKQVVRKITNTLNK
jgi:hypothetical protein